MDAIQNRPIWRIIAPTFLFGLFLLALGIPSGAADEDFFPWKKGDSWVYDTLNKQKNKHFDMKVMMEGPWNENDQSGMIMTQKDERGTMREFQTKNDKGFFIYKLGLSKALTPEVDTRFTPAVPRLIFPLAPGTKVHWEGRLKVRVVMDKAIIFDGEVIGWDDVTVPAGKFHCIKLHYHEKRGSDIIDEDAWYAEGVGQVKYDGGQYVKELKSYTVGSAVKADPQ